MHFDRSVQVTLCSFSAFRLGGCMVFRSLSHCCWSSLWSHDVCGFSPLELTLGLLQNLISSGFQVQCCVHCLLIVNGVCQVVFLLVLPLTLLQCRAFCFPLKTCICSFIYIIMGSWILQYNPLLLLLWYSNYVTVKFIQFI